MKKMKSLRIINGLNIDYHCMGEIINVGVGRAGCEIGYQHVANLCHEHGVAPDGTLSSTPKHINVHFEEK
jgi:hypothetical protein